MKLTALAALAALALTGCAVTPGPAPAPQPVQVEQSATPVAPAAPVTPVTPVTPAAHAPDESAYLDALGPGTVIPDLVSTHTELRAATLEAGYGVCTLIDSASTPELGMLQAFSFAEQHLSDPSTFTADMPALFTASAAVHLCGVTP